jgi:hypothetical protein
MRGPRRGVSINPRGRWAIYHVFLEGYAGKPPEIAGPIMDKQDRFGFTMRSSHHRRAGSGR